ncbi:hypothetical protein [Streptomyces scabiei]|uniref:hypothetical protein n=1 Tax=Streptomyces scabiei TaxID=1930 RepID=UPI0029A976DC|nr:hypothetical protein [Streptomyces scabiei]MDX2794016.1 hypothetical protein [Streptomyces scabiei]
MTTSGRTSLGPLFSQFSAERSKYRDPGIRGTIDRLERAAEVAVYAENESGGHARHVLSEVARVLGVVLNDVSPGRGIWDPENMARVIAGAEQLRGQRDAWKETAEDNDAANAPLRRELRAVKRERDALMARLTSVEALRPIRMTVPAELFSKPSDDVDELKSTIVRQAREITRLKGESE